MTGKRPRHSNIDLFGLGLGSRYLLISDIFARLYYSGILLLVSSTWVFIKLFGNQLLLAFAILVGMLIFQLGDKRRGFGVERYSNSV